MAYIRSLFQVRTVILESGIISFEMSSFVKLAFVKCIRDFPLHREVIEVLYL